MKSWSIAKALGIKDARKGIDWSIILFILVATAASNLLLDNGCRAEMSDSNKPMSRRCTARIVPALLITCIVMILQFQRLAGKCK